MHLDKFRAPNLAHSVEGLTNLLVAGNTRGTGCSLWTCVSVNGNEIQARL